MSEEAKHQRSVGEEPVSSALPPGEVPILEGGYNTDDEVLAALGYK